MDKAHFERLLSIGRLTRFYLAAGQDTSAASALYAANILLSESFYPNLVVAEVALRNCTLPLGIARFKLEPGNLTSLKGRLQNTSHVAYAKQRS